MICRICGRDLEIPADAFLLRNKFGFAMYQFPGKDRAVHEFKTGKLREKKPAEQPTPPPEVEQKELQEVVAELPAQEPISVEIEPKQEKSEFGSMAHAFGQIKKYKQFDRQET